MTRKRFGPRLGLALLGLALLGLGVTAPAAPKVEPLRLGLTPVILSNRVQFLEAWQAYLAKRLERPVELVQRRRYLEITNLVRRSEIEAAWLCGYPYVQHRDAMRLVAVPVYNGDSTYRSLLIVPAEDTTTDHITDLEGGLFAFADRQSNSGYLVPRVELARHGYGPDAFFGRTFFTWSHRQVIQAVAQGLAHGGAVDGYVYRTLRRLQPEVTAGTRIAWESPPYGFPPVVAPADLPEATLIALRQVLIGMGDDPEGRRLLERLNLDGFTAPEAGLYRDIDQLRQELKRWEREHSD